MVIPTTCEHYFNAEEYAIGVGTVRVTFHDGDFHDFTHIRYEANRMEDGFLVMENDDKYAERVYHVPNVLFWEVLYF